ncbi:unnamed protein product [Amaranthus hypochondriacus]
MAKTMVIVTCLVAVIVAVLVADVVGQTPTSCPSTPPSDLQQNCIGAYLFRLNPSRQCCDVLKREGGCLCTYASNPDYATFVNSDTSKRIAQKCNITLTC